MRLLSDASVKSSVGGRPIIMYVIAVDDDGTREQQSNLSTFASFEFENGDGNPSNFTSNFTEFMEVSYQYYSYALPVLKEDDEGTYRFVIGYYINICNCFNV